MSESPESVELESSTPSPASAPPATPADTRELLEQYRESERRFRQKPPRPLLGPSLVSAGILLWAYIAVGELVLIFGLPEVLAVLAVLGIFVPSALASGRQSLALWPAAPEAENRRLAMPGLVGFGLTSMTVLIVSAFARAGHPSNEGAITLFLLAAGFGAAIFGYRFSGPNLVRPTRRSSLPLLGARVLGALLSAMVVAHALLRLQ